MEGRLGRGAYRLGWSCLWIASFWAFLLVGFPSETAKGWLAQKLGQGLEAGVSIDELRMKWNLDVRLRGVSMRTRIGEGFAVRLDSLTVAPKLSSLIAAEPAIDFKGDTSSGGYVSGSYKSREVTLVFRDLSSRDFTIAALPVPSSATMSGSGRLKIVAGNGTIDTEVDGVPGGKQRLKIPGGEGRGLDGKLKITVSLLKR